MGHLIIGWEGHVVEASVTSHPLDWGNSQYVKAFGHDSSRGLTQEHPPHVHLHHLSWGIRMGKR